MTSTAAPPTVRWLWNGELGAGTLAWQLRNIRDARHRSVAISPWAGLTLPYLGGEYGQWLSAACAEADRLGIALWIGDDLNWPSGTAAGLLLRERPELAQRALVCTSRWVRQQRPEPVPWRGEGERLVLAVAAGVGGERRDLARMLAQRGRPTAERRTAYYGEHRHAWEAELWESDLLLPRGEWFVAIATAVRTQPLLPSALGARWAEGVLGALDALSAAAVRAFLDRVYAHFVEVLRPWRGGAFAGFVTAPPGLLDAHAVTALDGWRTDVLPWTPGLEREWTPGGALGFARDLPALLAQLHQEEASGAQDPLAQIIGLAEARYREAYWQQLTGWCAEHGVGLVAMGPDDLPAVPYTLRADRKRTLPSRVLGLPPPAEQDAGGRANFLPVRGQPLARVAAAADTARTGLLDVLQPLWRWEPHSLNVHPLDGWQRIPGALGERLRLQARFGADFAPPDLCLVFEVGTVEEMALNGVALNLAVGRPPRSDEVEFADGCARLLPLAAHRALSIGENVLEATVFVPAGERMAFPPLAAETARGEADELLGPFFVAGSFALRADRVACGASPGGFSLVRAPLELACGPWRQAGYPRFSGTATYRQTVMLPSPPGSARRLIVDAFDGRVAVWVNEARLGGPVASPCEFDITAALRAGINHLAIDVASSLSPRVHGAAAGLRAVRLEHHAAV